MPFHIKIKAPIKKQIYDRLSSLFHISMIQTVKFGNIYIMCARLQTEHDDTRSFTKANDSD